MLLFPCLHRLPSVSSYWEIFMICFLVLKTPYQLIFSNFKFSETSLSFLPEEILAPFWGYYLPNPLKDIFFSPSATWTSGHNGCKACLWLLKSEGSSLWCRVGHSSPDTAVTAHPLTHSSWRICRILIIVMYFLVTTLPIFNYDRFKEYMPINILYPDLFHLFFLVLHHVLASNITTSLNISLPIIKTNL